MEDLKQIQEFFGPPADVNTAYRVDFTRIENKEVVKDFELFKDLEKAKSKFKQLKKDPFMGSIKMEKIYGGQSGDGDRYLGGSEEIGSYSNPVNNTKSSELTDEEIDIKIYMTTPSFVSAKRGYKEKEDLMAYLGRRKKATSDFVNDTLEEMDINDPVLMKARAAKMKANQPKKSINPNYKAVKNASKIAFLKKEREQLMRDMEQEAEPEGGPIADEYGSKLNRIDRAIAKLSGRKEMTYDQAIAEVAVPSSLITKFAAEVKDVSSFASLLLNLYDAIQDKEQKDFTKNQKFGRAIAFLKDLADDKPIEESINVNEMKANEFVKTVNDEFDLETLELMKKVIDSRVELLNKMQDVANPRTVVKGFRRYDEIAETIKFIKENNPSATIDEIINELSEIKKLGETLNEELCAAGKAYRKRRMAAGEKSSAYLSGRAVKVCKGQMSGKKKKKK